MEGHEYDVDILNPAAVTGHYERMGKALLADAGPRAGKTLTHFYSVSWEGAAPTWSLGLDREFASYRGYSPLSYLPVLAGWTVTSPEVSERFERDYHKTLGDCFMNNFYGRLRELCHESGLKWHSESGGPWSRSLPTFQHADQLAFLGRNDMPQGEFWFSGRAMNRPPAMAAHIYGLPARRHGSVHAHGAALVGLSGGAQAVRRRRLLRRHQPLHLAHVLRLAGRIRQAGHRVFCRHALEPERHLVGAGRRFLDVPGPLPVPVATGPIRGRCVLLHRRQRLPALGPRRAVDREAHVDLGPRLHVRPDQHRSAAGSAAGRRWRSGLAGRHALPPAGRRLGRRNRDAGGTQEDHRVGRSRRDGRLGPAPAATQPRPEELS